MLFMHDPLDNWSFVYFIQVESGPIKVGKADNIEKRKDELQTANHEKLKLLHFTTGGRALESHLHEKFKKYNKLGEWFWPDDEIISYIKLFKMEDEVYGRIDSIVQFAKKNGFNMELCDKETLVELSRGSVLHSSNVEEKLEYWKILDAYENYLKDYPEKMVKRRRFCVWRNEGIQTWDKEIKKSMLGVRSFT